MRKILLGTTAVVGAALIAPAAFAQTPRPAGTQAPTLAPGDRVSTPVAAAPTPALAGAGGVTVRLGGFFDFQYGMIQDDWDQARSRNTVAPTSNSRGARQRFDMRNDLELHVFVNGRAANGMTYGAVLEFQMDNGISGGSGTGVDMDEAYGFLSFPNLGTLRFGQVDNAASLLRVGPPASNALGGAGEWWRFVNNDGLFSSAYLLSGINDGNDATKVVYLSPQFAGFDFGLSYAANSGEGRRTDAQRNRTGIENEWSAAIRYRGTFGPVGVAAGFGAMGADSQSQTATGEFLAVRPQQVTAYTAGASIRAYGFAFGGEFTWGQHNGSSVGRTAMNAGLDDSYLYQLGATYTLGPVVFGAVFGQAFQDNGVRVTRNAAGAITALNEIEDRRHTVWGIGAAYNLAPGLILYGYYNNINDKNVPVSAPVNGRYIAGASTGTTLASFNGGNTRTINILALGIRMAF